MNKNWKLKTSLSKDPSVQNEDIDINFLLTDRFSEMCDDILNRTEDEETKRFALLCKNIAVKYKYEKFKEEVRLLKANIKIPDIALNLLFSRGVSDYHKMLKFFRPTMDKLYDPLLMKDCDIASDRIVEAIENKEQIMILGDYDVDGTCGVSLFYLFLRNYGLDPEYYIPDRIKEGYGISIQSIDYAREKNIKLIVSIDCGITATDKVKYAKSLGIDFIICDHHQPPEKIPEALAVMDPLRSDDNYPFKYLCGTGVAFKLVQAIAIKTRRPEIPETLIDLVAIATASDIVPLNDENRILVNEGFARINSNPRLSLRILIESSGLKLGNLNTSNIVFTVAPRINAVGRLGDAKRAVELLTCTDDDKINEFTEILNEENKKRRGIDKSITDDAFTMFEDELDIKNLNSIIIHNEKWHPGVIGIVAARLVEKYNLPSIVLTTVNGVAKGSARSINSFNIYEALKKCQDHLIQFGGHFHAAGLEIELDKIDSFKESFNEIASREISDEQLIPEIEVDSEITFEDLSPKFIQILSFFEPHGPENMTPVFVTRNVEVIDKVYFTEKSNTHIFKVKDSESNKKFEAVFFNSHEYRDNGMNGHSGNGSANKLIIKEGSNFDICYSVDKNFWKGREYTKLRIRDIKPTKLYNQT
ncbi:MAG: single-stranded-DNA-specific exonuclease RecJ [Bacteroidetes bacterium]|nr:single-stranded-DNA-specific exonuclease RecJ [Bacteroidota bacterium]